MIIFVMNTKIIGYIPSAELTEERKQEILAENPYAVWVDEEINYPDETKRYEMYYIDGEIVYVEIPEPVEPEPTEEELLQAEMLLNQAEIIAKQNEQDEVLAEILLNQMGV